MKTPELPQDESARLDTLKALRILDTEAEERFDRYTRIARNIFDVPIVLVSLIDENRQWFKSRQGLAASETPRDISFCGHAILQDRILMISNAVEDERFADNPLVTGDPNIRFYAGCPIKAENGQALGTLCLIDRKPRELSDDEMQLLRDLGKMVEHEFTTIADATADEVTGISNRRGFLSIARHSLEVNRPATPWVFMLLFELPELKRMRNQWGRPEGENVVRDFARTLTETFRDVDVVARVEEDTFSVLGTGDSQDCAQAPLERFAAAMQAVNASAGGSLQIKYQAVEVTVRLDLRLTIVELLSEAEKRLHWLKAEGS